MSLLRTHGSRRTRRLRRITAAWVTLALLLVQQVALAAYVCPIAAPPAEPAPMMADCEHEAPDPAAPTLCHEHCLRDHLATPDLKVLKVPPLAFQAVEIALAEAPQPGAAGALYQNVPICQSDPPPTLRFCSLLI
jgi:hypothetical protein